MIPTLITQRLIIMFQELHEKIAGIADEIQEAIEYLEEETKK